MATEGAGSIAWDGPRRSRPSAAPVLMISLRAHGDSTGDYHDVGFGHAEMCGQLSSSWNAVGPANQSLSWAPRWEPPRRCSQPVSSVGGVHGYVLESPYRDLRTAAWNRTEVYLPPVLSHAAYAGLRIVGPLFLPHLNEISPLKAISGIPEDVPVLILAGDADQLARPEEAQALHRQVMTHGWLVFFTGAGHHDLQTSAPRLFDGTLIAFCRAISSDSGGNGFDKQ